MQNHILIDKYHGGSVEAMLLSLVEDNTLTPEILDSVRSKM